MNLLEKLKENKKPFGYLERKEAMNYRQYDGYFCNTVADFNDSLNCVSGHLYGVYDDDAPYFNGLAQYEYFLPKEFVNLSTQSYRPLRDYDEAVSFVMSFFDESDYAELMNRETGETYLTRSIGVLRQPSGKVVLSLGLMGNYPLENVFGCIEIRPRNGTFEPFGVRE